MSASPPAPINPTIAVTDGSPSKKRNYGGLVKGNVPCKTSMHNGLLHQKMSEPDHQKFQKLVEAAREEIVQQQQDLKRLNTRFSVLEQLRDFQE